MAVTSCIVTSCLQTKRNLIATVSIIHNSHVWGDENPHATVERNFQQRFSVNVWCAVLDDQLIGPFILEGRLTEEAYLRFLQVLSSWKVVLQEKRTSDFYRRNCPSFWRMCLWINEVVCISNTTELLILHVALQIS